MERIIIDSSMSVNEAVRQNPQVPCPDHILNDLTLFNVEYYSFDGLLHGGQVVAHRDLVADIKGAFKLMLSNKFPLQSVIPISDLKYKWDDGLSTSANNSSSFNYRNVRYTNRLSNHATGRALDINPWLNPYFPDGIAHPLGSSYNTEVVGTITADSALVRYFKEKGWTWGGDWKEDPDYQHFEKLGV